jgi:hypothetical protein
LLKPDQFPSEVSPGKKDAYDAAEAAVNKVKFRRNWDAELRASVYLNEFLTLNPKWMHTLTSAIAPKYTELRKNKGEQLRGVIEASDEREERFLEIIDQADEGVLKYWLAMLMIDAASAPATYQLIRVARRVGEVVVMCLKDHYREARPSQVCPAIVPLLGPPVHPTFPAGHALQSHLISTCLYQAGRARNQRHMLFHLSSRIAKNRVIAGLHYEADNDAGVIAADECFELLKGGKLFPELLDDARKEAEAESEA